MNNEKKPDKNEIVQNDALLADRINKCPECGSKNIITDDKRAEIFCADCGIVLREKIVDLGPEWRAFDKEQRAKRERTSPTNRHRPDLGLGTLYREVPGVRSRVGKIKPSKEQTLMTAYAEVNRICVNLGLSKEIEREAIELSKKAQKEKLFVGRGGIEKSVVAILLIVCRANKIPISIKEIASASFFPKKEILAKAKAIKKKFGIHITAGIDHYAFLPSFCSKLRLNIQVESLARKIIEIAEEQNLINDKRPSGVTAAAIYIAASAMGDQKKQKEIAIVSSLSDGTIGKRIDELIENEKIFRYLLSLDKI